MTIPMNGDPLYRLCAALLEDRIGDAVSIAAGLWATPGYFDRAGSLDAAWAEVVDALGPTQRMVLWAEKDGPQYAQVLAPSEPVCAHDDDTMRPVLTRLAAYPSKGLGDLVAELHALAATLREARR